MMDSKTTLKELKNKIDKFRKARNWAPSEKNLAISIVLEAAELLENFQWDDYKAHQDSEKVREELADVLIYSLEFAMDNNIDVSAAIEDKLKKNGEKYPVKLVKNDNSTNYYMLKKASRAKSK